MKQYLLDNGFTEVTKNTYSDNEDWLVIIRGKAVDVFSINERSEEWVGTAYDIDTLKSLLFDM